MRLLAPSGERVSLAQLTKATTDDGAEQINREGGQRYIAIKYSVRGRDLGSTVEEAIQARQQQREAARGLSSGVGRRIREPEARQQAHGLLCRSPCWPFSDPLYDVPLHKWAVLILVSVVMASIGGPLALYLTHTNFSVSSAVGFLALFGVSVETGVIMIEFINQLRSRRKGWKYRTPPAALPAAAAQESDNSPATP
jgi:cobalt-zinc-cadmium resistance protein CzcA